MLTSLPELDPLPARAFAERRRIADRVFAGAVAFNGLLTLGIVVMLLTGASSSAFGDYRPSLAGIGRVLGGVAFFYVAWGFVWFGIKTLVLRSFVGFTKEETRQAFSSRMKEPFEVQELLKRHSERRIRIADMIGRRGRFITLGGAAFYYLYANIKADPTPDFATGFITENLFDAVLTSWIFLAFYYSDGRLAAAFYGPQSRVMDGVQARANNLLITSLWTLFKFTMVPIGAALAALYSPGEFAIVFALIWGTYMVADTLAEVGGALYGKQRLRVWGIGDVNRKSIGGTVSGFAGGLAFAVALVVSHGLPPAWIGLAVAIAVSSSVLELCSPRGTDDFTMATANALLCLAFGYLR